MESDCCASGLYNGKELDTDFGLNLYFYGARLYDSALGRFTGVDPISDQFAWVSTYNYAENEPIAHIDLWGLQKVLAVFFHGGPTGGGKTTTPLSQQMHKKARCWSGF